MSRLNTQKTRKALQWSTTGLGLLSLAIVAYGFSSGTPEGILGRLLPSHAQNQIPWVTISAEKVLSGTTIPADTHVIIHVPEEIDRITRKTLFGRRGERVRYWGMCLPHNLEAAEAKKRRTGLPGDLFLSEKERAHRREILEMQRRRTFSIFNNLTEEDLNGTQPRSQSLIRHHLEVMEGGITCYVMTSEALPVGADMDGDELNSAMERGYGADPKNPDTDGDGILDGLEVFRLGSHPTKRDSDGDGIVDGKEDTNRNGSYDVGETRADKWDTDGDGLCDGACKVNKGRDIRGEDKNLNGIYEPEKGEYNPRAKDSDGDGIYDDHEVYLCVLAGGDDC